jgi:hypothetical protein
MAGRKPGTARTRSWSRARHGAGHEKDVLLWRPVVWVWGSSRSCRRKHRGAKPLEDELFAARRARARRRTRSPTATAAIARRRRAPGQSRRDLMSCVAAPGKSWALTAGSTSAGIVRIPIARDRRCGMASERQGAERRTALATWRGRPGPERRRAGTRRRERSERRRHGAAGVRSRCRGAAGIAQSAAVPRSVWRLYSRPRCCSRRHRGGTSDAVPGTTTLDESGPALTAADRPAPLRGGLDQRPGTFVPPICACATRVAVTCARRLLASAGAAPARLYGCPMPARW